MNGASGSMPIPVIEIDPYDPAVLRAPLPFYEKLRDAGPVVWLSAHGTYGTGRFDVTDAVLKDNENFRSGPGIGLADIRKPESWREPGGIVEKDPPEHTQIRKTMSQIISPRIIRGWKDAFTVEAKAVVDRLRSGPDNINAVPSLVEAFVLKIFPDALGVDIEREHLITFGNHNFNSYGPQNELFLQTKAEVDKISDVYARGQTREALIAGGFGELIFEAEDKGQLPVGNASAILRSFLRAGMDTTISGIGFTLKYLAERPDLYAAVRADPAKIVSVFEEALRLESPLTSFFRNVGPDPVELQGVTLQPDKKFQVFPRSANRDPRHWANPDEFDPTRKLGMNVAFGTGPHNCLGRMMAQNEAQCLLEALVERVARLELIGETKLRVSNALHTLDTLPIRLTWA